MTEFPEIVAGAQLQGKVCMVTGANSGIGKATALGLAKLGATMVMACRDRGRGEAARTEIQAVSRNTAVEVALVDLSSKDSIRAMVADFTARYSRLDVLVNNAAVFKPARTVTPDGLETMFATNHLGPFLLTNLLLDTLRASVQARILTVTAPSTTTLNFDDLQGEKRFRPLIAFGASKMCNLLFTYELARRLEGSGITVNAVHPGVVNTSLMKDAPLPVRWLSRLVGRSPERAAETPVYLASSPEVAVVTGTFFKDRRPIDSNAYSHNRQVQFRLWETSIVLAKMK
jgi:NAD(P)-dependent dehydrogenase (short-subunit alcohol dehydrogenase family)